jgi:hypothetical protein
LRRFFATAYAASVNDGQAPGMVRRLNPSGYVESQGGDELAARLGLPCRLKFVTQMEYPEPPMRINTDLLDADALVSSEQKAWDAFVAFSCEPRPDNDGASELASARALIHANRQRSRLSPGSC